MQMQPATSEKLALLNWISTGMAIISTRQPPTLFLSVFARNDCESVYPASLLIRCSFDSNHSGERLPGMTRVQSCSLN